MPVARCGFTLKPTGFFDRNPALGVPPPDHGHTMGG
jgi:primary-amine oxidase